MCDSLGPDPEPARPECSVAATNRQGPTMSLSARVLLGLALGIVVGLFFGPLVGFLGVVGDAFIRLLQMTVLPYIVVSLLGSLGSLSYSEAATLGKRAGVALILLWGIALSIVLISPLAYPDWPSASFFSHNLVPPEKPMSLVDLYIPANPFEALSDTVVPAVVVFTLALGIALIGVEKKKPLLEMLKSLNDGLTRVMNFVVGLAPYGVFAIAASAAGTMAVEEVRGLQIYVAVYVAMALSLALWILPSIVAALTPFRYRDVIRVGRAALITAFATGSVFVVLPVLASRTKEFLEEQDADDGTEMAVDVVVPTAFNLPSSGKLLGLSFVLFAGWISGFPLDATDYPSLAGTGLASFVGSTFVAIPFLLDIFRIPADTFRLFVIAEQVVGGRFGALVAAMHILSITLLTACALSGRIQLNAAKLVRAGLGGVVLLVALLGGIRLTFEAVGNQYDSYTLFAQRDLLLPASLVRVRSEPEQPLPPAPPGGALDRIRARGSLRVGFTSESLPFAFMNQHGGLVGFDVEMAHQLARDLGVDVELVRVLREEITSLLDARYLDVAMSGLALNPEKLQQMALTRSYQNQTIGFVVPDHLRYAFRDRDSLRKADPPLTVAVLDIPYYIDKLARAVPEAKLAPISDIDEFFEAEPGEYDALLLTAEAGASWSLIHPEFTVVVPADTRMTVPLVYAVRRGDTEMVSFLNGWLELKRGDLTLARLYDYWIQGRLPATKKPVRWSILRNVFGVGSDPAHADEL
jgi:proton glutamate symport protein